jgi:hypothetical protein
VVVTRCSCCGSPLRLGLRKSICTSPITPAFLHVTDMSKDSVFSEAVELSRNVIELGGHTTVAIECRTLTIVLAKFERSSQACSCSCVHSLHQVTSQELNRKVEWPSFLWDTSSTKLS